MTERRFTDKAELDPTAVTTLPADHPAMLENRTVFPTAVVEVTADTPDRLLVSGKNSRKLGETVAKGAFKGYALYGLSLEERATCPDDCSVRGWCYGNSTPFARRHRIGDPDVFYDRLGFEIVDLLEQHEGLLIRLHVLGDFPSVEYVAFWADALNDNPKLAVYGYTARRTKAWGGDEIGDAIQSVKDTHPDRFRIRWSSDVSRPDGAVVVNYVPTKPRIDEGLVCPAQTDAQSCCAACGLCWSKEAKHDTIVFIKHGPKSGEAAAEHERAKDHGNSNGKTLPSHGRDNVVPPAMYNDVHLGTSAKGETRSITAVSMPPKLVPKHTSSEPPEVRLVDPTSLRVEARYQRDLSGKSIKLIRQIVAGFSWAKFKPPIVAETSDGLFVIDGQHTAIAAASHPGILKIPVLIASADMIEARAGAFVAHNRDRLTMSVFQVFHAEVVAGNKDARLVAATILRAGGSVPRSASAKGFNEAGQVVAVNEARQVLKAHGEAVLFQIVRIGVLAALKPLSNHVMRGLRILMTEPRFTATASHNLEDIAKAVASIGNLDARARTLASETDQKIGRAVAVLIEQAMTEEKVAA